MNPPSRLDMQNTKTNSSDQICTTWNIIKDRIIGIYGETVFRSWFKAINFHCYDNGTVFLTAPSRFVRDWIKTHYLDFILRHWSEIEKNIVSIDLVVVERNQIKNSSEKHNISRIKQSSTQNVSEGDAFFDVITNRDIDKISKIPSENNLRPAPVYSAESIVVGKIVHDSEDAKICFDRRYTFENFVEDKSNDLAYFACKMLAEKGRINNSSYNLLFLYGGVGLGKTHLMHAVANHKLRQFKSIYPDDWLRKFNEKVIYMPSQKFVSDFITSIKSKTVKEFKRQFRNVEILMIDDVQFFMGKGCTQEEFFNLLNSLMNDGKQLIVTADRVPGLLTGFDEKIRSRLGCGFVADVQLGDLKFRTGVLRRKSQYLGMNFADEILNYLAQNIENNIRELEGALNKLAMIQQLDPTKKIDIPCIQSRLYDMLKPQNSNELIIKTNVNQFNTQQIEHSFKPTLNTIIHNAPQIHQSYSETVVFDKIANQRISVKRIQKQVCDYYNLSMEKLLSNDRSEKISFIRQLAMYLVKDLTSLNLKEIAYTFERKNHSTVIHNINRIEDLIRTDSSIKNAIFDIRSKLNS